MSRLPYAGIVGSGRTCALVDARGRIGWLCVPTFAQFPIFASLLDPHRGGRLELGLRVRAETFWSGENGHTAQYYLPHTNTLVTDWSVAGYTLTIADGMPWGQSLLRREVAITGPSSSPTAVAPTLLVRMRPTSATPPSPRFRLEMDGIAISETRCPATGRLVCRAPVGKQVGQVLEGNELILEYATVAGRLTLEIAYEENPPAQTPGNRSAPTDAEWLDGTVRVSLPDQNLQAAFERSLLTLRLLVYEPTGALLAAATASLPSEPGGTHNWDYRFCWVRDGSYAAQAFDAAGCSLQAERLYEFLLAREHNGQWSSPLWSIEADYPVTEESIIGLSGPGGETPVRIGNGAAQQEQHDSPGNVLAGVYRHCLLTGTTDLAARNWERLARAVDWCCEHWAETEAGIWERRDRNRAWVHGRALCWVAIRDGIRLAGLLGKPVPPRWETTLVEIPPRLRETAWSEAQGAFVRACDEPSILDISTLALLLHGLISPDDERMRQTVEKMARALAYGPAFRRDEEDERHPFYLATFWMIRALAALGEFDRAYYHLSAVLEGATDLGLMGEYFDPLTSQQFGNFPQAYSHEELIETVTAMLWDFDGRRLVLFPSIPDVWLAPGNRLAAANLPLGKSRGTIALDVGEDSLRFAVENIGDCAVIIPPRYFSLGKRVELKIK